VYAGAAALVALYLVAFAVRLHCSSGRVCDPGVRFLDLDGLGSLPRLVTTAVFVAAAVLASRVAREVRAPAGRWWWAVSGIAAGLAVAKLFGLHWLLKTPAPVFTLTAGVLGVALTLSGLLLIARRWQVRPVWPVVVALAAYAGAAIGLDALGWAVALVRPEADPAIRAATALVEELGEALSALLLLGMVGWTGGALRGRRR
jgi:hypothetical protein